MQTKIEQIADHYGFRHQCMKMVKAIEIVKGGGSE